MFSNKQFPMSEIRLPSAYTEETPLEHRQKFGQFFTPLPVAEFMANWVADQAPTNSLICDPAMGLGVFYQALRNIGYRKSVRSHEIDPHILAHTQRTLKADKRHITIKGDYLQSWTLDKYHGVIANPPYMKFQDFGDRKDFFTDFEARTGTRLSGYTNSASAFLIKSISELSENGRLAYIMPLEFLTTGYGEQVKNILLNDGLLKTIIRFENEKEVFPDALTSVGILLCSKSENREGVRFITVKSISELKDKNLESKGCMIDFSLLEPSTKWLRFFDAETVSLSEKNLVNLRHHGAFKRGIATGANEFFVLKPSDAKRLKLPGVTLIKAITRSAIIKDPVFSESDVQTLVDNDDEIYLFDGLADQGNQNVKKYIQEGQNLGYDKRFLTSKRTPWYRLEERPAAPLLFGVFSRDKFKVILNRAMAKNLTCYHGFYPKPESAHFIDSLFVYFQTQTARTILSLNMRRYGGGLDKFEPNDLNEALVPSSEFLAKINQGVIRKAVEVLDSGGKLPEAAEEAFRKLIVGTSKDA
jgi:adenine-specific DNA-methyltransferase